MATKRIKIESITMTISSSNLQDFVRKIQDLTKIDDKIKIKFNSDHILMYSAVVRGDNPVNMSINAFKSHVFDTQEIFSCDKPLDQEISFIVMEGKKFCKNISNIVSYSDKGDDVKLKLSYNDSNIIEKMVIKDPSLTIETRGEDPSMFKVDMDVNTIKNEMKIENADFNFSMTKDIFDRIKKLSAIENKNDIYSINIIDQKLTIGENTWNLELDHMESEDDNGLNITFPKKYFNTINYTVDESMVVYVFGKYLLIMNESSNLMISTEEHA